MSNSLYDPDRIKPIIDLLQKQWEEHPQMRLCQLIVNITNNLDPFYVNDDDFKRRLKEYKF
jgi:uncharacterized protein YihD (DUF1040 family)